MGKKICLLEETTINQIAAGEVVESPASVVKELVENALDAGATRIEIEIKGGGHLLIEVRDNGCGMGEEDALLSFERHATSKIKEVHDLLSLSTMGFRGEALASIASVAKVEMETKEEGGEGTKVICHGGKLIKASRCAREKGTTIRVASLFYNVPARRKFQKSSTQATQDIVKIVSRLALANKEVSFSLISQEKEILRTSGLGEKVAHEVLGEEFTRGVKPLLFKKGGYLVEGFVGTPLHVRTTRSGQYFFINKRAIVSPLLENSVRAAFGTRLGSKEHPIALLSILMPSEEVDVNVHPQKTEVRFHKEEEIFEFVKEGVETTFGAVMEEGVFPRELPRVSLPRALSEERGRYESPKRGEPLVKKEAPLSVPPPPKEKREEEASLLFLFGTIAFFHTRGEEDEERLILLDTKRAKQKLLGERMLRALKESLPIERQKLLFPEQIPLTEEQEKLLCQHHDVLQKLGLDLRSFGKGIFILEEIPPFFSGEKMGEVVEAILSDLEKGVSLEALVENLQNWVTPRSVNREEAKPLLSALMEEKDPFFTSRGRKVLLSLGKKEVEELFMRREYG